MPHNKFLIAAKHPLIGEGLACCLENALADTTVKQVRSFGEAKEVLNQERSFRLIILDLSLSDTYGFSGLVELRGAFPEIGIIVLASNADAALVRRAITLGASGIIAKSEGKEAVVEMVSGSLSVRGKSSPAYGAEIESGPEKGGRQHRAEPLTEREICVLHMLCGGLLNKQIAHSLNIGTTTVKSHVTRIMRKLRVGSRTKAVIAVASPQETSQFFLTRPA